MTKRVRFVVITAVVGDPRSESSASAFWTAIAADAQLAGNDCAWRLWSRVAAGGEAKNKGAAQHQELHQEERP
jgi:hypothetical protein